MEDRSPKSRHEEQGRDAEIQNARYQGIIVRLRPDHNEWLGVDIVVVRQTNREEKK